MEIGARTSVVAGLSGPIPELKIFIPISISVLQCRIGRVGVPMKREEIMEDTVISGMDNTIVAGTGMQYRTANRIA